MLVMINSVPPRLKHDVGIKASALRWIRSYLTNDSTIFFQMKN